MKRFIALLCCLTVALSAGCSQSAVEKEPVSEGYELYLAEITAEQERLKATFFFYQQSGDFETEHFPVFLSYQNGVWKAEG